MRTSVASRPSWRTPAVGTLALALAAFVAGTVLTAGPQDAGLRSQPGTTADLAPVAAVEPPTFRVASFNILGANHTDGARPSHKSFAPSTVRTPRAISALNLNRVDVVGFQEMQAKQFAQFKAQTAGAWAAYPGAQLTNYATHNTIAWRTAKWSLVEANSIPITYFNGTLVPMPYVLLRHVTTGRLVWFANFHNPASTKNRPPQYQWRMKAKAAEIALANRLWESGLPLVITGDMNEKETYFCSMTTLAPMKSASGGSYGAAPCRPPADVRIDWVFGSNFLQFSNYRAVRGDLVQRTTDHPLVVADVTVPVPARS